MMNIRYKLRPCSLWNIGIIETWLTEMAAKGLFVVNFGRYFTKFIKSDPAVTHYRIDVIPTDNDEALENKINRYKACGWKYVNTYMNFHIFSSPHEFNSNEVYTITEHQALELKPIYKSKLKEVLFCFTLMVTMILLPKLFMSSSLSNYLLDLTILDLLSYLLVIISFLYLIYEFTLIKKIIKSLNQGVPINHEGGWRLKKTLSLFFKAAFVSIILLLFFAPSKQFLDGRYTFIEENIETFPVVTLKDIGDIKSKADGTKFNTEAAAWLGSQSTPFMPVQYDTSQAYRKFIKPNEWKTLELSSSSYRLRFQSMVDDYFKELIKKQTELDELLPLSIDTLQYKGFDTLKLYKSQDTYFIYAAKGNGILTVSYLYDDDIHAVIKAMEIKMDLLINYESKL